MAPWPRRQFATFGHFCSASHAVQATEQCTARFTLWGQQSYSYQYHTNWFCTICGCFGLVYTPSPYQYMHIFPHIFHNLGPYSVTPYCSQCDVTELSCGFVENSFPFCWHSHTFAMPGMFLGFRARPVSAASLLHRNQRWNRLAALPPCRALFQNLFRGLQKK